MSDALPVTETMAPRWKSWLLAAYYQATRFGRSARMRVLEAQSQAPVMIVFYHRVANIHPNPWTISERMFVSHVRWMQRHLQIVSLEEAQRRVRHGNPRACVAITFDDGYADNMRFALPWLVREKVPATYFVCAGNVMRQEPFPHDLQRGIPLSVNTVEDLRVLSRHGIEIGAHTNTHADLGKLQDAKTLYEELVVSAEDLQRAIHRPIRYFAFPYGQHTNLSPGAFELAFETGFEAVVSAYGGYNMPGDDAFHLQRISADTELVYVKNWLTMDPRKLAASRRYQYLRYKLPPLASEHPVT